MIVKQCQKSKIGYLEWLAASGNEYVSCIADFLVLAKDQDRKFAFGWHSAVVAALYFTYPSIISEHSIAVRTSRVDWWSINRIGLISEPTRPTIKN